MKKLIPLVILIIGALLVYQYLYQDHRDIESETAAFVLTAQDITYEFEINPSDAESNY